MTKIPDEIRKRKKCRKRKATKQTQIDFELCFFFTTSTKSEQDLHFDMFYQKID